MPPHSLMLLLAAAASQSAPPPHLPSDRDEIDVIGKAPPEIRREATEYVHQLGIANGERTAARWIDPICPEAVGLQPAQSALVEGQVRSIAKTVGAPVSKGKCSPNLLVVFTNEPKGLVESVFRKIPPESNSASERKRLQEGNDQLRWWYSSEIRSKDGPPSGMLPPIQVVGDSFASGMDGAVSGSVPNNDHTTSMMQPGSSLVSTQVNRALTHATVVIDANAVTGKSLESVVDYATLVGLAEIRLGASTPNSILGLFGSTPNIGELTVTDRAFLTALYAMNLNRRPEQHRRVLIGEIIRKRTHN